MCPLLPRPGRSTARPAPPRPPRRPRRRERRHHQVHAHRAVPRRAEAHGSCRPPPSRAVPPPLVHHHHVGVVAGHGVEEVVVRLLARLALDVHRHGQVVLRPRRQPGPSPHPARHARRRGRSGTEHLGRTQGGRPERLESCAPSAPTAWRRRRWASSTSTAKATPRRERRRGDRQRDHRHPERGRHRQIGVGRSPWRIGRTDQRGRGHGASTSVTVSGPRWTRRSRAGSSSRTSTPPGARGRRRRLSRPSHPQRSPLESVDRHPARRRWRPPRSPGPPRPRSPGTRPGTAGRLGAITAWAHATASTSATRGPATRSTVRRENHLPPAPERHEQDRGAAERTAQRGCRCRSTPARCHPQTPARPSPPAQDHGARRRQPGPLRRAPPPRRAPKRSAPTSTPGHTRYRVAPPRRCSTGGAPAKADRTTPSSRSPT